MSDKKASDLGQAEVQKAKDAEEHKGFEGVEVDPTPNEHYTVDGVIAGKPTPENDPKQAAEAGSTRFHGVEEAKK